MNLGILAKRAGKVAADNSPAILTAIGVTGAVTTALLVGKASFKAAEVIAEETARRDPHKNVDKEIEFFSFQEKTELVWKLYVPAATTGVLTIAAIVCANRIGTRRAAALASAYSISEKAMAEYKDKVLAKFGEKKEQTVRDEIAQDRVNAHPVNKSELVVMGTGTTLCKDTWSGRYFNSDMETLRKAVNDLNQQVINNNYASLTDFWDLIGLPKTDESDEVGWTTDKLLDAEFAATIADDGKPCITLSFRATPVRGYGIFS